MKKRTRHIWWFIWSVGLITLITISAAPSVGISSQNHLDKILHFGSYFCISIFAFYLARSRRTMFLSFMILAATAVGTEIIQSFIPSREGSLGDIAANFSGIFIGFLAIKIIRKIRR